MISIASDLHIHSCLSPCGDEDMTPNNIVNMAAIKGLEMISLTDHNSARNLPAIDFLCREMGLLFVPGIEVQSMEDVHLLCYFPTLVAATEFGSIIEAALPPIQNVKEIFGRQLIRDKNDEITGELDVLLLQSVRYDLIEVSDLAKAHGGLCVPAHINRQANSLLYTLGFFPEKPEFTAVELNPRASAPNVDLKDRHILYSSDAHYLEDILEATNYIRLPQKTVQAFLDKYSYPRQKHENQMPLI